MAGERHKMKVTDDPSVSEIFADQHIATQHTNSITVLTFGCTRIIPERIGGGVNEGYQPRVQTTARLVLTLNAVIDLANTLNVTLARLGVTTGSPPRIEMPEDTQH